MGEAGMTQHDTGSGDAAGRYASQAQGRSILPKELTHILFAESLATDVEEAGIATFAEAIEQQFDSFRFGAIAPHIFDYELVTPFDRGYFSWTQALHGVLGEDTSRLPAEMVERLKRVSVKARRLEAAAFIAGVISNYALDRVLNPYILHRSGPIFAANPDERADARVRFQLVNSWLDLQMLHAYGLQLSDMTVWSELAQREPVNKRLTDFMGNAFTSAHSIQIDVKPFLQRFAKVQMRANREAARPAQVKKLARLQKAFPQRLTEAVAFCYPRPDEDRMQRLFGFDSFVDPVSGETRRQYLEDLLEQARLDALRMLDAAAAYLDDVISGKQLRKYMGIESLLTGRPGGSVGEARFFDPIDIADYWTYGAGNPNPVRKAKTGKSLSDRLEDVAVRRPAAAKVKPDDVASTKAVYRGRTQGARTPTAAASDAAPADDLELDEGNFDDAADIAYETADVGSEPNDRTAR